jgi:hypothetical protein
MTTPENLPDGTSPLAAEKIAEDLPELQLLVRLRQQGYESLNH